MKNYQLSITGEELGYLAIHIERLRLSSKSNTKNMKTSEE